jgi:hypothetical protein
MSVSKIVAAAASGVGGAGLDVDEVFATRLYRGTGSSQSITTDIDLGGEGGLVWIKQRDDSRHHQLFDTVRGVYKRLKSSASDAEQSTNTTLTAFNDSSFSLGNRADVNESNKAFASWSFRKAEKFFDIVTYSGNGSNRAISHNLGSVPGMIIVKGYDRSDGWAVYHRGTNGGTNPENYATFLNGTSVQGSSSDYWNNTAPTSTQFTVGTEDSVNNASNNYIAYVFAHNNGDGGFGPKGDQDIIKCGNYTGNGSTAGPIINLGFEPQWVILKRTDSSEEWFMYDIMRGFDLTTTERLSANTSSERSPSLSVIPTATGFQPVITHESVNASGGNYIFLAIRKGPLNVPENATKVFTVNTDATGGTVNGFRPHEVDMAWFAKLDGNSDNVQVADRVRGFQNTNTNSDNAYTSPTFVTNNNNSESASGRAIHQTLTQSSHSLVRAVSNGSNFCLWGFKRAPSYFDMIAYNGSSSAQNITHNLDAIPEMMWIKSRANNNSWTVFHKDQGATKRAFLSGTQAFDTGSTIFNNTAPTATQFTVGTDSNTNYSGHTFMAYLFASADGVSKVGSFSHTNGGGDTNVDCGFSSGARLVMCKRASDTGSWYLFNSARGIVSGNDPHLELNSSGAEVTGSDVIDPLNSGFTVTSGFLSSGTYIFWAIA